MLTSFVHETRSTTLDPSDEGIDDTFESARGKLTGPRETNQYQGPIDDSASREHSS